MDGGRRERGEGGGGGAGKTPWLRGERMVDGVSFTGVVRRPVYKVALPKVAV